MVQHSEESATFDLTQLARFRFPDDWTLLSVLEKREVIQGEMDRVMSLIPQIIANGDEELANALARNVQYLSTIARSIVPLQPEIPQFLERPEILPTFRCKNRDNGKNFNDPYDFIVALEDALSICEVPREKWIHMLRGSLPLTLQSEWMSGEWSEKPWTDIVKAFLERYLDTLPEYHYFAQLGKLTQKELESVQEYASRLRHWERSAAILGSAKDEVKFTEIQLAYWFIMNLYSDEVRHELETMLREKVRRETGFKLTLSVAEEWARVTAMMKGESLRIANGVEGKRHTVDRGNDKKRIRGLARDKKCSCH